MTTASELITSARYDLRDEDSTQYSTPMLLDYLNRGLRPMCVVLSMLKSDWVNTEYDFTLLDTESSVTLPTTFVSDVGVKIGTEDLVKQSVPWIRDALIQNAGNAGEPQYYAIQGTNILFDIIADDDYAGVLEYNTNVADLTTDADLPFNNEFNDVLRQFIVLAGKSRNEYALLSDVYIQDFFYQALFSRFVSRNHIPNTNKTDF